MRLVIRALGCTRAVVVQVRRLIRPNTSAVVTANAVLEVALPAPSSAKAVVSLVGPRPFDTVQPGAGEDVGANSLVLGIGSVGDT